MKTTLALAAWALWMAGISFIRYTHPTFFASQPVLLYSALAGAILLYLLAEFFACRERKIRRRCDL